MLRATFFGLIVAVSSFSVALGQDFGYNSVGPTVQQGKQYAGWNTYGQDAPVYNQNVNPNPYAWRPAQNLTSPFVQPQQRGYDTTHRHDHYHHAGQQRYGNTSHYYPTYQYCQPQVYQYPHTQQYWYYYYPNYCR